MVCDSLFLGRHALKRILMERCHNLIEDLDQDLVTYLEVFLAEVSCFLFNEFPKSLLLFEVLIENLDSN